MPSRRSSQVVVIFFLLVNVAGANCLQAQGAATTRRVKHQPVCGTCKISVTKVVTLGTPSDPVLVTGLPELVRDSRGRYFASSFDKTQIVVFGPEGKYIAAIGRSGGGPGELGAGTLASQLTQIVVGVGDTIYAFHSRSRVEVFSPALRFVRTVILPRGDRRGEAVFANGNFFVSSRINLPAHIGFPYHILTPSGGSLLSFGGDGGPVGPDRPGPRPLSFEMAADLRSLWTGDQYRLSHWGMDGKLLHDYELYDVPWLLPARAAGSGSVATPAAIAHLAGVDSSGLLWMNGSTPVAGTRGQSASEFTRRLEVFDPATGSLLVSEEGQIVGLRFVARTNLAYNTTEGESGIHVLTVYRLELTRPRDAAARESHSNVR